MKLRCYRYQFPFVNSFQTSNGSLDTREGAIIQLQHNEIIVYGEAAPLPGHSSESLSQVIRQLRNHKTDITRLLQAVPAPGDLDDFYDNYNIVPSLRFALDTLAYNYSVQTGNHSINLLNNSRERVAVNAVIPIRSEKESLQAAQMARQDGYKTFKVKVGRDFSQERKLLEKLRIQFPGVTLRLDANRAWTVGEAVHNLTQLQELNIEYCEEPIKRLTYSTLKKISEHSPVPIALDETLTDLDAIRQFAPLAPFLILKPTVVGKFSDLIATKRLAASLDHTIVLTTSLESGIGRLMTAVLASAIGSRHSAHGLSTGPLLAVDIWSDGSYINKGYFFLPDDVMPEQNNRSDLKQIAKEILTSCE